VLLIGEWALVAGSRRLVAVLFYLHYAGLGAVLISGFWSVINERFDPRTAKRVLGSIAAGGTLGGVVGGVLAAQAANVVSVTTLLPVLAAVHLACGWLALLLARSGRSAGSTVEPDARSGFTILAATPYLRTLLGLVLLTTVAEGLLDFTFKARASAAFAREEDLLRLFAWFHTSVAAAAFALQAGVARSALQHLGLTRTVAALPTAVVMEPCSPFRGLVRHAGRGVEAVTRNGLYRAGYELLFAPLPPHEKRATKVLVDVGAVRLGDVLAGLTVQATLMALVAPERALLAGAIGIALAAAILTVGLRATAPRLARSSWPAPARGRFRDAGSYTGPRCSAPRAPWA
jgi:ATP/ADP translocase